jgi:hypothetical protein
MSLSETLRHRGPFAGVTLVPSHGPYTGEIRLLDAMIDLVRSCRARSLGLAFDRFHDPFGCVHHPGGIKLFTFGCQIHRPRGVQTFWFEHTSIEDLFLAVQIDRFF